MIESDSHINTELNCGCAVQAVLQKHVVMADWVYFFGAYLKRDSCLYLRETHCTMCGQAGENDFPSGPFRFQTLMCSIDLCPHLSP